MTWARGAMTRALRPAPSRPGRAAIGVSFQVASIGRTCEINSVSLRSSSREMPPPRDLGSAHEATTYPTECSDRACGSEPESGFFSALCLS
jgi:hypothetical protein